MLLSHVGTSYYIAPEIVGKTGYGPAVDVWACGVVLYVSLAVSSVLLLRIVCNLHQKSLANISDCMGNVMT